MQTDSASLALGLLETRGYTGLIAATDAATKTAGVEVHSIARATGGLVLVALVGDVASVQVAVAAGVERAQAVGSPISAHVIARPDDQVWKSLGFAAPEEKGRSPIVASAQPNTKEDDLDALPVRALRHMARSLPVGLTGRQISNASRDQILSAIRAARSQK
ncbi:MAG: hypothetical protein BWY06_01067 [Candidatus Latescibacteria bacterium ADurb.Bin168]|nr:MAG: hypothetical protein BWY06_01067 [Candidatus Latescibacteria bacterium ADurb.Bin168]